LRKLVLGINKLTFAGLSQNLPRRISFFFKKGFGKHGLVWPVFAKTIGESGVVYIIFESPARGASPLSCLILSTILDKLAQMQLTGR
jgi:hypothetical protein